MRSLLADRDVRLWVVGRTVSVIGAESLAALLPIAVFQATGSARWAGVLGASVGLPYLLFGLWAGAVADRVNRKRLMVGADVAAAATVAGLIVALSVDAGSYVALLVIGAFVVGTCFVWFDAAAWGALPVLVGRTNLVRANSLVWGVGIVAAVAAPSAATIVAAQFSFRAALGVCAAGYALSAAATAWIRRSLTVTDRATTDEEPRGLRTDIAEGLRFIRRTRPIRVVTTAAAMLSLSSGAVVALTIVYATEGAGLDPADWRVGAFFTCAAVGALAASQLLPVVITRFGVGRAVVAVYALYLPLLLAVALAGPLTIALIAWALWFGSNTGAVISGISVRQLLTPDRLQGRVNTSARMLALGGAPIGALTGGYLAAQVGVRWAIAAAALPVLIALTLLVRNQIWLLRTPPADGP